MCANKLFVISIQRSGSNWLHRCLAEHPGIKIHGELNPSAALTTLKKIKAGDHVAEKKLSESGAYLDAGRAYINILMRINADVQESGTLQYISDRTAFSGVYSLGAYPEQYEYAGVLDEYFPDAKKIIIVRSARDVIVSFSEWKKQVVGSLLKTTPRSIAFFHRHLHNWCALHEHWLNDIEKSHNWLVISYEDMKNNFTGTLEDVFTFLELDADDEFISQLSEKLYRIDNPVYQKENKERGYSFFRKGEIGDWEEKFKWWHKVFYDLFFKTRVENIYSSISRLKKP